MYYYFSSEYPAVIKLNGIYFGEITNSIKHVNVENDSCFIEVCPLDSNEKTLNFFPSLSFLKNPPETVSVTDLKGGYLIKFFKSYSTNTFKVIKQSRFTNALFTVFTENGYKLSIESEKGFYAEQLRFSFDGVDIYQFCGSLKHYAVIFYGNSVVVNVYDVNLLEKVFSGFADSFNPQDNLLTLTSKDMAKHVFTDRLSIKDDKVIKTRVDLTRLKNINVYSINEALVPYAFLEELLAQGNVNEFITGKVYENSDRLKEYLGDFIGVMPPPFFRNPNEVGLIYKIKDNLYSVDYCTFEFLDRKISNVKKSED